MEHAIFEFVAIYGVLCICVSKNTVSTSVVLEVVQNHCKIQHFGHRYGVKLSQIAVFLLRLLSWVLQ